MTSPLDVGSRFLDARVEDGILTVRIDRADRRNAMTQDMYRGVKRAAIHADTNPEVDALCITGTDDVFAVGGDMAGGTDDATLAAEHDPTDHFPFRHLERCRVPVFAAVNGICHAGGVDLVLYSDFAIASDRATFRVPELLRGAPDPFIAARLADHVGIGNARFLLMTAARLDAHEALRIGLVSRVVPHDDLPGAIAETSTALRRLAPRSTAVLKDDMNRSLRQPDVRIFQRSIMGPEIREGMAAFVEKRPAVWPRDDA